jgi:MoxR-like ATPase
MSKFRPFQKISQSPTNPHALQPRRYDLGELYQGPAEGVAAGEMALDEKLRQAYFWIVNHAIISPYYDIEYHEGTQPPVTIGDNIHLTLPSAQSY